MIIAQSLNWCGVCESIFKMRNLYLGSAADLTFLRAETTRTVVLRLRRRLRLSRSLSSRSSTTCLGPGYFPWGTATWTKSTLLAWTYFYIFDRWFSKQKENPFSIKRRHISNQKRGCASIQTKQSTFRLLSSWLLQLNFTVFTIVFTHTFWG